MSTAAGKILRKALVGSKLGTAGWDNVAANLRDRAFFSAKVEDARILHAARQMCAEVAEGKRSASEFRRDMRALLEKMGHPHGHGGLTDLYSRRRLDVLRETNVQQARGWAQHLEGTTQGALLAFPAQELVRLEEREHPRNWIARWQGAGGKFIDGGRMIALKGDPIWTKISRFGTPWPPFDFNSGMGVEDIDRDEAVALGLIGEDDPPPEVPDFGFNDDLEAVVDFGHTGPEWQELKASFGDQIQFFKGADGANRIAWRGNAIRENFDKGGKFTMRLGKASDSLLEALAARKETAAFVPAMEGQDQLCVTQRWLDRLRKDKTTDHRAHFGFLPDHPESKPLAIGDIDLIPSVWRKPDRVFDAGDGCICLETDSVGGGDFFRLIVKVMKGDGGKRRYPDVKTFYRTDEPFQEKSTPASDGASRSLSAPAPWQSGSAERMQA